MRNEASPLMCVSVRGAVVKLTAKDIQTMTDNMREKCFTEENTATVVPYETVLFITSINI